MYKLLILIIVFIGIILVNRKRFIETIVLPPIVKYKYIPRTFAEEQALPVYPSEIFETMFSQPSPWLLSIRNYDRKKQEQINQYFISQM